MKPFWRDDPDHHIESHRLPTAFFNEMTMAFLWKLIFWVRNLISSGDQMFNVLLWPTGIGSGDPDETLSRYWGRKSREGAVWAKFLCRILNWFDDKHCNDAVISDPDEGMNTPGLMARRKIKGEPVWWVPEE